MNQNYHINEECFLSYTVLTHNMCLIARLFELTPDVVGEHTDVGRWVV